MLGGYVTLLFVWAIFVAPALRAPRGQRFWPAAGVIVGGAAALYEAWVSFIWGPGAAGPIRVDILLISPLLVALYLVCAWQTFQIGWTRCALLAGAVTAAAALSMVAGWRETAREVEHIDTLLHESHQGLFEAKFRSAEAFEAYFEMGALPAGVDDFPTGHWAATSGPPHTRLVINPAGRIFLFYRCGPTECQFGPGAALEASAGDAAGGWKALLERRGVGQRKLEVTPPKGDVLWVAIDGSPRSFRRAPPPLLDRHEQEALVYLGTYSVAERLRQHARVSQLWLWQGEDELFAIGVFQYLLPGRRADFVTPELMGRGRPEGTQWRFHWGPQGRAREVLLRRTASGVAVERPGEDPRYWPPQILSPGAIFRDEVIDLAPRTTPEAWERWFATQFTAHFLAGEIPALPEPDASAPTPHPAD